MPRILYKDVTIASGSSTSAAFDTDNRELIGVRVPATMTGTALTVETSDSVNGTFQARQFNGDAISITIAGGEDIQFNPPIATKAARFDSGTNEGAERTLTAILVEVAKG